MEQQLCLRWNKHQKNLIDRLQGMLRRKVLMDVTLVCNGETFKAHQTVLSAGSEYFEAVLFENTHPHPILFLCNVGSVEMKALLQYMYEGEVNVTEKFLPKFLKVARSLKVRGLAEIATNDNPTEESELSPPSLPVSTFGNNDDYSASFSPPAAKRERKESGESKTKINLESQTTSFTASPLPALTDLSMLPTLTPSPAIKQEVISDDEFNNSDVNVFDAASIATTSFTASPLPALTELPVVTTRTPSPTIKEEVISDDEFNNSDVNVFDAASIATTSFTASPLPALTDLPMLPTLTPAPAIKQEVISDDEFSNSDVNVFDAVSISVMEYDNVNSTGAASEAIQLDTNDQAQSSTSQDSFEGQNGTRGIPTYGGRPNGNTGRGRQRQGTRGIPTYGRRPNERKSRDKQRQGSFCQKGGEK